MLCKMCSFACLIGLLEHFLSNIFSLVIFQLYVDVAGGAEA